MRRIYSILILLMGLYMEISAHNIITRPNTISYTSLSPLSVNGKEGVSAPFFGSCGDFVIVAGGCNFPNVPAAEGGKKFYYDHIYAFSYSSNEEGDWSKIGNLSSPRAYGASVTVPDGVVVIGGTDGKHSLDEVVLLKYDGTTLLQCPLPTLPIALDNMGAAFLDGYIYVAGGQSNGTGSFSAYRLAYPKGRFWEILPDMPGSVRLQPACVAQNDATAPCFYVMGGFTAATGKTTGFVHNDGLCFNALTKKWKKVSPITAGTELKTLVGAAGVPSGCTHMVFAGGVNFSIFEEAINSSANRWRAESKGDTATMAKIDRKVAEYMLHPSEWYKFNNELLIYHTITDTWTTASQSPLLARAGAALVPVKDGFLLVDGELKPGIRSADVTAMKIEHKTDFGFLNWSVLIVYLLIMLSLGFYFMKREGSSDDFFKGGGRIPWWAAGISIYATMLSAITYMAYPAKAFATDWTYCPMLLTILLVAFPVIRYYLPFFRRLKVASAYEYLEQRFNAATRTMASALFIVFIVLRMGLVLYLPSLALTAVTGIDIYICIILMGIITIVYSTMGGVEAVIWGDVVQGVILIGGAILSFVYLIVNTEGGAGGCLELALADDKLQWFDWSLDYRSATFWVIILGGLANNFISYTSDQTIIQRYMTTKDEKGAKRGLLLNGVMSVGVTMLFFAIGTGLYTFFKTHPAELDFTMEKADSIFPFFMMSQLPAGVAGLLIAAIFSATMSTISSSINSVSTAFTLDFYKRHHFGASERRMLSVARYASLVSGLIGVGFAVMMATWNVFSMLDLFQEILGLVTSGLGGLFLMGIFFPRIGAKSAILGFCTGVVVVFWVKYTTDVSFLLYGAIGLVTSVLTGYLSSFWIQNPKKSLGLTWHTLGYDEEENEVAD